MKKIDMTAVFWISFAALVVSLLLLGCGGPAPIIREATTVEIPSKPVPCKPKIRPEPKWATDAVPRAPCKPEDVTCYRERMRAAFIELTDRIVYMAELQAALDGCAGKPPS